MNSFLKFAAVVVVCSVTMYFLHNMDSISEYFFSHDRVQTEIVSHEALPAVRMQDVHFPESSVNDGDKEDNISDPEHAFHKVTMKGVLTLENVCIEPDPKHRRIAIQQRLKLGSHLNATRKVLVVYNSPKNVTKVHKVGAHSNVRVRDWEVIYRTGPPPGGAQLISSHVAYFITTSCDGNLWLFFEDTLRGLHALLKKTNRLRSKEKNIVFYREPLWDYSSLLEKYVQCWDPRR